MKSPNNKVYHRSGGSNAWETPDFLFNYFNDLYDFTLDAAASDDNHLCARYFTEKDNALIKLWTGRVWLNPPYSAPLQDQFIEKVVEQQGNYDKCVVLIPVRTDTSRWHKYILNRADKVLFLDERLHFSYCPDGAGFPSAVVIYNKYPARRTEYEPFQLSSLPGYDDYMSIVNINRPLFEGT